MIKSCSSKHCEWRNSIGLRKTYFIANTIWKKSPLDTSSVENIHSMLLLTTVTSYLQLVWTCKEDSTRKSWKNSSSNHARHYISNPIVLILIDIKQLRLIQSNGTLALIHRVLMSSKTFFSKIMAHCFHLTYQEERNGNSRFVITLMTKCLVASIFTLYWEAKSLCWDSKYQNGSLKFRNQLKFSFPIIPDQK